MKKFLLRFLGFIGFSIITYVVLVILFGSFAPAFLSGNLKYRLGSYGHMFTRLKEANNTKDVDILFLGSSHSYRGYDPRIFGQNGFKSFNLGSSAQTPLQTEVLVDRYLDQMNPRVVVFDVYPSLLSNDGVESSLDLISNGDINSRTLQMALSSKNVKVYNTLMYSFFLRSLKLNKGFQESKSRDGDTYIEGGYVETYRKYKPSKNFQKSVHITTDNQLRAFDRIIRKIKDNNIGLILIQAPMTKGRYSSYQNNETMDSLFSKRGPYYNFNKLLSLSDSMFFDDGHLNQLGVNVFNKKVIEILNHRK